MERKIRRARGTDAVALQANALHQDFLAAARRTLQIGVKIGGLLALKKEGLAHGEWLPWCSANLAFGERTARNYMRLWTHRAELKSAKVSDLAGAYRYLEAEGSSRRTALVPARALAADDRLIATLRPALAKMSLMHRLRFAARIAAGG